MNDDWLIDCLGDVDVCSKGGMLSSGLRLLSSVVVQTGLAYPTNLRQLSQLFDFSKGCHEIGVVGCGIWVQRDCSPDIGKFASNVSSPPRALHVTTNFNDFGHPNRTSQSQSLCNGRWAMAVVKADIHVAVRVYDLASQGDNCLVIQHVPTVLLWVTLMGSRYSFFS